MQLYGYGALAHPESKVKSSGSNDGMPLVHLCSYWRMFIAGVYCTIKEKTTRWMRKYKANYKWLRILLHMTRI